MPKTQEKEEKTKLYHNWPAICSLDDVRLRIAIALIEMHHPVVERLIMAFPECYSNSPVLGPVPLSAIKAKAGDFHDDFTAGLTYVGDITYECFKRPTSGPSDPSRTLPRYISNRAEVGDPVVWKGEIWIVACLTEDDMIIVPAGRIDFEH